MHRHQKLIAAALLWHAAFCSWALAQSGANASQTEQRLDAAAAEQKFAFVLFYKDNGAATQAMAQAVKRGVQAREDRATAIFVNIGQAAERGVVERFGVARAPMPLTVAVAPNGATTKVMPGKVTDEQIEESFVTPAMADCIKSMQEGKLVFICIHSSSRATVPAGVRDFQRDAQFQGRCVIIPVSTADAAESELVAQLEADVATKGATTVLLAPPGVLVGKFGPTTTMQQYAAALHKAGQCCDDPNCKHNHSSPSSKPASGASRSVPQRGARR